jgi:hypothetical protein
MLGDGSELVCFVSPQRSAASMRSPLLDWEQPRQITAPPKGQSQTQYPEIMISGRTSSHPRGNAEYITPGRGPKPSQPESSEPPNEDVAWWGAHLKGR